ncbi:hypothetical protein [Actinomadura macrotermitis]|uniref:hypothetical protein n=1 Tax=Actinomadura macrotermitis TaxID=2585200 RepID=UPI00129712E0|nr:hypothetical protein [Actinomadura macrotermitis]
MDIKDFTGRDDRAQIALRHSLFRLMSRSFDDAELPWRLCLHEDRGDGVLVVVPVPVPVAVLAPALVRRLGSGLAAHNRGAAGPVRFRLRAALHTGVVHRDPYGMVGGPLNHTFRLVDAPAVRDVLTAPGAELSFVVSDTAYRSMLRADGTCPLPLRPVTAETKRTRAPAWIWTGGSGPASHAADPAGGGADGH